MTKFQTLKILSINSLPAFGNAGLKCVLAVLKHHVVPVPSLVLSATGNVRGFQRYTYPFEENLLHTLDHLSEVGNPFVVYIGYLADATQVGVIQAALEKHSAHIHSVVIDPVCGDNGRSYVSDALVNAWNQLLPMANWLTPNSTEVGLLTQEEDLDLGIDKLQQQCPNAKLVITSYVHPGEQYGNLLLSDAGRFVVLHEKLEGYVTGSGDMLASYFIKYKWIDGKGNLEALQLATEANLAYIRANLS